MGERYLCESCIYWITGSQTLAGMTVPLEDAEEDAS